MKIFTDLHHGDLHYSLYLLFCKRLGYELYHQMGIEWFEKGYWKVAEPYGNPIATVKQFLDPDFHLYKFKYRWEDGVCLVESPIHNYIRPGLSFEKFKSMKFDIMMPSHPAHGEVYEELRDKYQPQAKIVMQMGNIGQTTHLPNVLHSCVYNGKSGQHCLYYHQEIDPEYYYYIDPPAGTRNIYSIVNLAPYIDKYEEMRALIPDAQWRYYGVCAPEGPLIGVEVPERMREANVAWHLKPAGGVGHVTKGWFAIGRPLVTNMSTHRGAGGFALELFQPDITCIDLDSGTVRENETKIRRLLEPEENLKWCKRVNARFKDVVNYDEQEQRVRKFMEEII